MNILESFTTIRFPTLRPEAGWRGCWRIWRTFAPARASASLLLALNLFLLLGAYYMLKTVREALILTQGGAEVKSYSAAGQATAPAGGGAALRSDRLSRESCPPGHRGHAVLRVESG